ncbi:hypothetical protein VOLCADRAFT_103400 [Volvox carteri f. nagariensis]|uniref:RING-type domain-containing protein n=1 Tax=Volvox carteri f. nagariensis TaxID=3068 RepID=D8TLL6_VOLCA|nr:uncharacterized protein VOLCADRAFT_103400 [Volvox carteri f. nagariensis]EFJ51756.1 hypothetical protein VOLCADRAFT_103400 [Volvox carteri f. nagariensis]|eukprot:XP_002947166.1 hypothetical protein VOLCADRAFT_103400 [Volvox carteri f. nagariensis]
MKKSLGRALGDMSLEKFWDKEGEYCDTEGFEDTALDKTSANASANKGSKVDISEVCAICLNTIELEDLAIIKGCEHEYCVNCILQWATCKEAPWCPQCKKPFNYLYCHRLLDGTLSDMPVEESVCLMKRASWFVEYVKTMEKGKAISGSMAEEEIPAEWADPYQYYDDEEDEYDEDEQIEKYYFSSAAGRARVVLGNRRLGENGYMRAGRMYARPTTNGNTSQASGSASGGIGKPGKGRAAGGKLGPRGSGIDDAGEGPSSSQAGAGHERPGPQGQAKRPPCRR